MKTIKTEFLVIGSGFGAAAPALRLSEAGFQILMIEKGPNIVPERDFKQTQDPQYYLQYLKTISCDAINFTYAEGLGGGSGFYEMVSLRAPSKAFEQVDKDGRRLWPSGLDRQTMDPFYDLAERMLHVEQISAEEVPKAGQVFSMLMKRLGYSCDRARYAVKGCVGSGYCVSGCIFGAKQSLHYNYLPQAREAGMEVLTDIEALSVRPLDSNLRSSRGVRNVKALPFRYEIQCRNRKTGEVFSVEAKAVILGGGTVGTAALLLNSRNRLPFLSDHIGKNIAFNGSVKAVGLLPEGFIDGDMLSGRTHPGMVSYQFLDSMGITVSAVKPLPLMIVHAAHLYFSGGEGNPSFWGKSNVELMKMYRRRMIILYAMGLTPPTAGLRSRGNGTYDADLEIDRNVRRYYSETKHLLQSILSRNGCRVLDAHMINGEAKEHDDLHFSTSHMVGSCRMANNNSDGVVDAYGEVFDYPGLYVTDGASVPTSLAVNSSLTILANAERIAAHLARWYKGTRTGDTPIVREVDLPILGAAQ